MAKLIVFGPTWSMVVDASSHSEARQKVLELHKMGNKPYLARDWKVRLAKTSEVEAHEARLRKKRR